ncbi:hypothetical protein MNBD_GAMMA25-1269 [hydrothermal vent metagenome]|uniref:Copper metallochaperone, bacterial analog of Cox17 protein n=1 Tax=hydrothermal vent metagenome TaxID=652676 RepID=A0A3B1BCR0_9ZZZZ
MNQFIRHLILILGLLLTPLANSAAPALSINGAYSPEAPPVVKVLAAYMMIENKSANEIKITAIQSPDFDQVEIHRIDSHDGMMRMVKQEHLTIPAGKVISLSPGELHIMLLQPHRTFKDGDVISLQLTLNNGTQQTINVPVRKRNL